MLVQIILKEKENLVNRRVKLRVIIQIYRMQSMVRDFQEKSEDSILEIILNLIKSLIQIKCLMMIIIK